MQIQPGPSGFRQRGPVSVDFSKQGARRLFAVLGLKHQRQRAVEVGILHRYAGNIAIVEIFDGIHRGRIDPARTGWRHDDKDGSLKAALPFQFGQREFGTVANRIGVAEAHIDPNGLLCRSPRQRADLAGTRP